MIYSFMCVFQLCGDFLSSISHSIDTFRNRRWFQVIFVGAIVKRSGTNNFVVWANEIKVLSPHRQKLTVQMFSGKEIASLKNFYDIKWKWGEGEKYRMTYFLVILTFCTKNQFVWTLSKFTFRFNISRRHFIARVPDCYKRRHLYKILAQRFPSIIWALEEFIVRFIESINPHSRMLQKSDFIYFPPTR